MIKYLLYTPEEMLEESLARGDDWHKKHKSEWANFDYLDWDYGGWLYSAAKWATKTDPRLKAVQLKHLNHE